MGKKPSSDDHISIAIEVALQGLAFWISYRQTLCHEKICCEDDRRYINEGALVAEFVVLLRAKLDTSFEIRNESEYGENNKNKMDVEIRERGKKNGRVAIIEFKRDLAGKGAVIGDVKKLLGAKEKKNMLRYLVVVSEYGPPKILDDAKTSGIKHRVFVSAKSLRSKEEDTPPQANYCCLLKISPKFPTKGGKK
jgi:hypothetical protein